MDQPDRKTAGGGREHCRQLGSQSADANDGSRVTGSNVVSPPQLPGSVVTGLQARDVVAFGHEIGRALSDGRIVGRAEPFAKVFASSRAVKRAVGLVAWAILEDIALDAHLDDTGRLIATTNVRRIATNLAINKDTAAKHLARLRELRRRGRRRARRGVW